MAACQGVAVCPGRTCPVEGEAVGRGVAVCSGCGRALRVGLWAGRGRVPGGAAVCSRAWPCPEGGAMGRGVVVCLGAWLPLRAGLWAGVWP